MPRLPRKRPIDYILPFLIMICAGVIVVLAYQLWSSVSSTDDEKDIYMYLAGGSAKILPWGAGEWERAYNGTRLLQGDSIKTQKGGRIVIEFFEDNYVRLDEKSEIIITEIKENGGSSEITLLVREGNIWLNNDEKSQMPVKFIVQTDHTLVRTVSTVYEVENDPGNEEIVRVINGNLFVDIFVEEGGQKKKVETSSVGVGQEAVITSDDLKEYAERTGEGPSIINALSDEFKESAFYKWNMAEDLNPTDFSLKDSSYEPSLFDEGATEDVTVEEGDLATPVITTPSTLNFTTEESSLTIRGTTVAETQKMMVDLTNSGETETYELNLYIPGNTEWSFKASHVGGEMKPGTNVYEFYALGEENLRSAKAKLTVIYGSEDLEGEEGEDEEDEELDLGPLTTPEVETYNGGTSNEVDVDTVAVSGSVSGAKTIVVNGYTLKAFEPGDETWTYYAKESLGNLDPGENTYTVVAVAPDGTEKSTEVTIIYNKPESAQEETTEEEGPASQEPATGDAEQL